jgi:cysteine desulfuration protein SufE
MIPLPPALEEIVRSFESLPEAQRRDLLLTYAAEAPRHRPRDGEHYLAIDERIDPGCIDPVGLFLGLNDRGSVSLRARFGAEVQTLTRALVSILCRGLEGATLRDVAELPVEFIPEIAGAELMRWRGRSVYHVMNRLRQAAQRIQKQQATTANV